MQLWPFATKNRSSILLLVANGSSQLHKTYQSRCTAKNSRRWAERLPETCRVIIPIKLEFSASVGFIHKESVTMHSHTIVKKKNVRARCVFLFCGIARSTLLHRTDCSGLLHIHVRGMWCYVIGWVLPDISNNSSALKTPRTAHPTRKHHIPEDCCESVNLALYIFTCNMPGLCLHHNSGCHWEIFHCFPHSLYCSYFLTYPRWHCKINRKSTKRNVTIYISHTHLYRFMISIIRTQNKDTKYSCQNNTLFNQTLHYDGVISNKGTHFVRYQTHATELPICDKSWSNSPTYPFNEYWVSIFKTFQFQWDFSTENMSEFCRLGNAVCVVRGTLCDSCGRLKRSYIYRVNHPLSTIWVMV